MRLVHALVAFCLGLSVLSDDAGWKYSSGNFCYRFLETKHNAIEAVGKCKVLEGTLPRLHDPEEMDALRDFAQAKKPPGSGSDPKIPIDLKFAGDMSLFNSGNDAARKDMKQTAGNWKWGDNTRMTNKESVFLWLSGYPGGDKKDTHGLMEYTRKDKNIVDGDTSTAHQVICQTASCSAKDKALKTNPPQPFDPAMTVILWIIGVLFVIAAVLTLFFLLHKEQKKRRNKKHTKAGNAGHLKEFFSHTDNTTAAPTTTASTSISAVSGTMDSCTSAASLRAYQPNTACSTGTGTTCNVPGPNPPNDTVSTSFVAGAGSATLEAPGSVDVPANNP